jgi:hypothetical protein
LNPHQHPVFNLVDTDGGGSIEKEELAELMDTLGIDYGDEEIDLMMTEIDEDKDGEIVRLPAARSSHAHPLLCSESVVPASAPVKHALVCLQIPPLFQCIVYLSLHAWLPTTSTTVALA